MKTKKFVIGLFCLIIFAGIGLLAYTNHDENLQQQKNENVFSAKNELLKPWILVNPTVRYENVKDVYMMPLDPGQWYFYGLDRVFIPAQTIGSGVNPQLTDIEMYKMQKLIVLDTVCVPTAWDIKVIIALSGDKSIKPIPGTSPDRRRFVLE